MSVHGLCFDNGQAGRCGPDCELYIMSECDIGDEICEIEMEALSEEEINDEIECSIEEVRLFVLRGSGVSQYDLFCEARGYKK